MAHSYGSHFISVGQQWAKMLGTGQAKVNCRECFCSGNSSDFNEGNTLDQLQRNFSEVLIWSLGVFFLSTFSGL